MFQFHALDGVGNVLIAKAAMSDEAFDRGNGTNPTDFGTGFQTRRDRLARVVGAGTGTLTGVGNVLYAWGVNG